MYNIYRNMVRDVRIVERDIPTWEQAQDAAMYYTLTTYKQHDAILVGGKAEQVMQERARWTRIMDLVGEDFDDAGCDWILVGTTTCIADPEWKVTENTEVAQLLRESLIHEWGEDRAKQFIYTSEADYYQRDPKSETVEA